MTTIATTNLNAQAERLSREYAEEVSADELEQNTKDEFTTAVHDEKPTENSFYDRTLSESPTQRRKGSMARRTSLNATPTSTGNGIGEGIYGDWVDVASGIVEEATMTAQEVAEEAAAKAERLAAFIASLGDEYVDPDPDAGLTLMEITAKRLDESDKVSWSVGRSVYFICARTIARAHTHLTPVFIRT